MCSSASPVGSFSFRLRMSPAYFSSGCFFFLFFLRPGPPRVILDRIEVGLVRGSLLQLPSGPALLIPRCGGNFFSPPWTACGKTPGAGLETQVLLGAGLS